MQTNGIVHQNGFINEKLEEVKSAVATSPMGSKAVEMAQQPGMLEMFISVCGIYGALYISRSAN